jgi:hypothetical protein
MKNSEPPLWLLWLLPLIFLTLSVLILRRWPAYARSILHRWAVTKRYEILHFERCFFCGAFPWWTTSQRQMVFFVTVRDDSGRERSGWIRFGSYWGGDYNDEPDIIWGDTEKGSKRGS